jgi:predicted DNA-binding transcriptional regulator AlpA
MLEEITTAPEADCDIEIAGEPFYTVPGFARRTGKTERTIRRWIKQRIGPPVIKLGSDVLILKKEVPGWLKSLRTQPVALVREPTLPTRSGRPRGRPRKIGAEG